MWFKNLLVNETFFRFKHTLESGSPFYILPTQIKYKKGQMPRLPSSDCQMSLHASAYILVSIHVPRGSIELTYPTSFCCCKSILTMKCWCVGDARGSVEKINSVRKHDICMCKSCLIVEGPSALLYE